jgi:hypothetical protein
MRRTPKKQPERLSRIAPASVIHIALPRDAFALTELDSSRFLAMMKTARSKAKAIQAKKAPNPAKQVAKPDIENSRMCDKRPQMTLIKPKPAAVPRWRHESLL